jgi:DDT domain
MARLLSRFGWRLCASCQRVSHEWLNTFSVAGLRRRRNKTHWNSFRLSFYGSFFRTCFRRTKKAQVAKSHRSTLAEVLKEKDESLSHCFLTASPPADDDNGKSGGEKADEGFSSPSQKNKRRGSVDNGGSDGKRQRLNDEDDETYTVKRKAKKPTKPSSTAKKKTKNRNSELAEREDRAMGLLEDFLVENGGTAEQAAEFTIRVTKKTDASRFDTVYHNSNGRRFRSMLEVGRFLGLVKGGERANSVHRRGFRETMKKKSTNQQEAEKKRLRRELEKLRKQHQRATKNLDDLVSDDKDVLYPVEDFVLMDEEAGMDVSLGGSNNEEWSSRPLVTKCTCAAARIPDIQGFDDIPAHCIPDVLLTFDFLCTFHKVLSLTPIGLDDFANALAYRPPQGLLGDDALAPPVYIAEAHLGLINLLLQDGTSNDWWWSLLEDDETGAAEGNTQQRAIADELQASFEAEQSDMPTIRVDMASLFAELEEPLITTSVCLAVLLRSGFKSFLILFVSFVEHSGSSLWKPLKKTSSRENRCERP